MEFFRYWALADQTAKDAKGNQLRLQKWRGSDVSVDEALRAARHAVEELSRKVANVSVRDLDSYAYGVGGRPEELIDKLGERSAITRNRYGCLVLNVDNAMFVDIDLPNGGRGLLAKLSGKTEQKYIERLQAWLGRHREASVRVYRTAAGLRYLFTHAPLDVSDATLQWQAELGGDRIYTRLCKVQKCYRARLTPKPWRIKIPRPAWQYPCEKPDQQKIFKDWLNNYQQKSQSYATCKFLNSYGEGRIDRSLDDIVKKHDSMTGADSTLPLA